MIDNINYIIVIILILLFLISKYYYLQLDRLSILFLILAILITPNKQISILLFLIIGFTIIENKKNNFTETFISENNKENNKELDFVIEDDITQTEIQLDEKQKDRKDKKNTKIKDLTPYKIDTDLNKKLDMLNHSLQIFKQKINS